MNPFKLDDKIECINAGYENLTNGKVYTVTGGTQYWVLAKSDRGTDQWFTPTRFKLYEENYVSKPLIGEKYEANHSGDNNWYEVVVIYQHPENKEAYACMNIKTHTLFWSSDFKAVKTPEQLQLDKVMSQIKELQDQADKLQSLMKNK